MKFVKTVDQIAFGYRKLKAFWSCVAFDWCRRCCRGGADYWCKRYGFLCEG